jgi:hypothetical protein
MDDVEKNLAIGEESKLIPEYGDLLCQFALNNMMVYERSKRVTIEEVLGYLYTLSP